MSQAVHILEVRNLKKYFKAGKGTLKAVDDVSFFIRRGETLGVLGESGCGKTTCGRTCIGIYDRTDGEVLYKGKDVHSLKGQERKDFTKEVQIIFQDPYSSLDPKMKVGDIIAEGLRAHKLCATKAEEQKRVHELLETVGLNAEHATRYVHEFSGGQRQRIGIARALAVEPEFIVCDEPISALDVSIQAQIVNLLIRLQKEKGLTYMFIAHDLSMVKHISDRVAVMYLGTIAEITDSGSLYSNPLHPYTKALLSAIPIPDPKVEETKERIKLEGELPSPIDPPPGCRFQNRCQYACERCRTERPELREVELGHYVACHLVE
ncbi:MAG: ATP-binding cassette domain-containing protein [Lachnospiraceae bacterium]|nr:ATP-binding cassette domain-containing protein [Lachnospiraceae bacterium]